MSDALPDHERLEQLLTAREVAELLAVPESWVREATREHKLPFLALGRYRRYQRAAIQAWLSQQRHGPHVAPLPADLPTRRH